MQAKELVQDEFYQQKRTSRLQVTTLVRLLQLLQRDVSLEEEQETDFVKHRTASSPTYRTIDRQQEEQEVSFARSSALLVL